jgi:Methyltransferase domain
MKHKPVNVKPANQHKICPICRGTSAPKYEVKLFVYLECSECHHIFISSNFIDYFGRDFYKSSAYKQIASKWAKSSRIQLFSNIVAEAERQLSTVPKSILDYGAGSEDIVEKRALAPQAVFYDPYFEDEADAALGDNQQFDCVILTEVLEHVFDPISVLRAVRNHSGLCLATTLLHDVNFDLKYLDPESGHVSIYSRESLMLAARLAGFEHEIVFWNGQYTYYYHLLRAPKNESTRNMAVVPNPKPANPLLEKGRRFFSQNDEDGILLEILRRIGRVYPGSFLELGVDDGRENNTLVLLSRGWRGAWLGSQDLCFEPGGRLSFEKCWITRENVVEIASAALARIGSNISNTLVFSVDLDGNDFHIVETLLAGGLRPDVFIVEYNAKFPPESEFVMPYDEAHTWNQNDYFGASLHSWSKLLGAYYRLVACNATGSNAFYVKYEYDREFTDIPRSEWDLFQPGFYQTITRSGHPISAKTLEALIRS